MIETALQIQA